MSKRSCNLQVEPRTISEMTLIKNQNLTHPPTNIYIWIPHPRDPGGWNFVSCKEVLLVSLWNIIVLGDLAFHEVKKGFHAGRIGCNPLFYYFYQ